MLACIIAATLLFASANVALWVDHALDDSSEFASRVTATLDSREVRDLVSAEIVDQLTAGGTNDLVPYTPVLLAVTEVVVGSDAFRSVFRQAVEAAHRLAFDADDDQFLVNLTDSVGLITQSLQVIQPEIADGIADRFPALVVDVTDQIRGYELWQTLEQFEELSELLLLAALLAALATFVLAPSRRVAGIWLSMGAMGSGLLVVGAAALTPNLVASLVSDPLLSSAMRSVTASFVEDLRVQGISLGAYGAIALAVASTPVAVADRVDPAAPWRWAWSVLTRRSTGTAWGITRGLALVLVGWQLVANPAAVATVIGVGAGLFLGYLGVVQLVAVVGRRAEASALAHLPASVPEPVRTSAVRRRVRLALGSTIVVILAVVTATSLFTVGEVRTGARADAALVCNGAAELCDRRLDEVAFAATHNSMAAASEPGWFFAEQTGGIAEQLDFGVRALLIDTYYGVLSGFVPPGSSVAVVITDRAASAATGVGQPEEDTLPDGAAEQAERIAEQARPEARAERDIYLCHNWCELGATPLRNVLGDIKAFLDRHPDEVIILFVEDYTDPDDVAEVFGDLGMLERVWVPDDDEPFPTLRELITSRRQLVVLSEHAGPGPPWYLEGFELVQDTPFRFASPEDFSCERNRGVDDAPMFLINHWLDTGSPSVPSDGNRTNTVDVLGERVERCAEERDLFPNIVAVNWYEQGDLLEVVDQLNGVDREDGRS